jgi:hypothetical protein
MTTFRTKDASLPPVDASRPPACVSFANHERTGCRSVDGGLNVSGTGRGADHSAWDGARGQHLVAMPLGLNRHGIARKWVFERVHVDGNGRDGGRWIFAFERQVLVGEGIDTHDMRHRSRAKRLDPRQPRRAGRIVGETTREVGTSMVLGREQAQRCCFPSHSIRSGTAWRWSPKSITASPS